MKYLFIFIFIIIIYIYFLSKCRDKNFDNNYCKKFYMDENRSIVEKDFLVLGIL